MKRIGFGQVEPNHLSAQRTGQIYAQLPAHVKKASGDYLFFVDSDDYIDRVTIENMVKILTVNAADIVQCQYIDEYIDKSVKHNCIFTENIFNDENFNKKLKQNNYILSSANSINIGRLLPQVVYYFYSYLELVRNKNIKTNLCL